MSKLTDDLQLRRDSAIERMTAIAKHATHASRDLTPDEAADFTYLESEVNDIDQRLKSLKDGEARAKEIDRLGLRQYDHTRLDSGLGRWAREARSGEFYDVAPSPDAAQRAIALFRSPEYRAMSAAGGTGPNGVYNRLWEYAVAGSQILQAGVSIIATNDGNALPLPVATAHATASASAAANALITASDAAITTVNLTATKYGYITYVPTELLQDATFDIEGYLARAAGRALGNQISSIAAAAVTAGFTASGATAPTGSLAATGGVFPDALLSLFHSVLPEYRSTAAWLMSDPTAAAARKAKDAVDRYYWVDSLAGGEPSTLLGKGVYIDPSLPAPTGTNKIMYFGDWSALAVRIAGGIRFERSDQAAFATDQVAFRAIVRTGAVVTDPNAVKFLQLTAA